MIEEVKQHETVVSIDIPTGVNADTGEKADLGAEADYTVTLAMPKKGISEENSGEFWDADIFVLLELYEKFGFETRIFENKSLVKVDS